MATALSNTEAYICFYLAGGEGKLASGRGDLVHKLQQKIPKGGLCSMLRCVFFSFGLCELQRAS